jgi:hypothetical protein
MDDYRCATADSKIKNIKLLLGISLPVASPPPVPDHTNDGHGHKSEIKNSRIQSFRRFFT